ncbi:MAG: RNA polymerase sigma factor RpoD/SigA [Chloroflexia bacterium]|nr:RNA polymerase sigma factor RpoD/SigA [Chloroflexia bacterium]
MRQLVISKQITNREQESISRYFREINKYPLIPIEEEVELTVKIKKGDEDALQKLVLANLRFVVSVAKQYQNRGLSFPDLINEGNLGLVKAASRFDETKGFKFISYAVWWIRQSITQAISEQTRTVRLPINRISSINKITSAIPYLEQELEREPTNEEIASYLDLPDDDVLIANTAKKRPISFDKPFFENGDTDFNLYDLVPNETALSPDNRLLNESLATDIERALKKLSQRESEIITLFYGLNKTSVQNVQDIASNYNMTKERIRQIRNTALTKLKKIMLNGKAFV